MKALLIHLVVTLSFIGCSGGGLQKIPPKQGNVDTPAASAPTPQPEPIVASCAAGTAPCQEPNVAADPVVACEPVSNLFHHQGASNNKLDVLFIIDDSNSMAATQNDVKAQIQQLIATLDGDALDYRLALTTTDMTGKSRAGASLVTAPATTSTAFTKVVTKASLPTPVAAFTRLMDQIGVLGSNSEYGFLTATVAFTETTNNVVYDSKDFISAPAGKGTFKGQRDADFYRPDAALGIVIISDEDDGGSPTSENRTPASYIPFFQTLKSDPSMLTIVAIVDPSSGPAKGCAKTVADTGAPRYHDGIQAFGQHAHLIDYCDDISESLALVGKLVARPACKFALTGGALTTHEPHTVCIAGGECLSESEYTYEAPSVAYPSGRVMIAETSCPIESAEIEVSYSTCSSH